MKNKVIIFPCSGIGKSLGTVSREAAYEVCQDLKTEETKIGALSLLVMGDDESRLEVTYSKSITIDGCKLACASKMIRECNGQVLREISVLDEVRKYRGFKPEGIEELNEGGKKLAHGIAADIAEIIDQFQKNGALNA